MQSTFSYMKQLWEKKLGAGLGAGLGFFLLMCRLPFHISLWFCIKRSTLSFPHGGENLQKRHLINSLFYHPFFLGIC